jgi:hypothetical protein
MADYYEREDWELFTHIDTIAQHAGINPAQIPALVVKELVDNALDAGGSCEFGLLGKHGFFVSNPGESFPGTNNEIAHMFSMKRPLRTSKLLRRTTRGVLGNGLRFVMGAVFCSQGSLRLTTKGRHLSLTPQDNGQTAVRLLGKWSGTGTRIEVNLPDTFGENGMDRFVWAKQCQILAQGEPPLKRSSALWYDSRSFWHLLRAARGRTVREEVEKLEGCSGAKAGRLLSEYKERPAESVTLEEAAHILSIAQAESRQVRSYRLGPLGKTAIPDSAYCLQSGTVTSRPGRATIPATIPFLIEVWAKAVSHESRILLHVNRSPVITQIHISPFQAGPYLTGCGLWGACPGGANTFDFWINIQTPYVPFMSNSKEPNLRQLNDALFKAMRKTVRAATPRQRQVADPIVTRKRLILDSVPEAINKASGGSRYRYSLRQLFYAIRPTYLARFKKEPDYDYFCQVISAHESCTAADLPGIYRDNRGTLYHPHMQESIPLGTLAVENYARPAWTFNKILYCEKEGFFPILIEDQWPERNDCALLTSKGFASKAARDVLDLMGKTEEPLTFFCIHDADGPGTQIFEALQGATSARPGRDVTVINLGLEPEEAIEMDLAPEPVTRKGNKRVPVASYVLPHWKNWLQKHRVELNALDTPSFLAWLDRKLEPYNAGKLIPPPEVMGKRLHERIRGEAEEKITAKILEEARLGDQVQATMRSLAPTVRRHQATLTSHVDAALQAAPTQQWVAPVDNLAQNLLTSHLARHRVSPAPTAKPRPRRRK